MTPSPLLSGLLLAVLFLAPYGVYTYVLARLGRPLQAFAAGSAVLFAVMAVAMSAMGQKASLP